MTVVKAHLPSLLWIWHPGLKFVVLSAAEGHCWEVLNSWSSQATAKGWGAALLFFWAVGCWPSAHWHRHFAPTARLCRCSWTLFGHRTKDEHFWNKNRGLESEWCLLILICSGFFGACTQAEQIHGQVPAPFTALTLAESANSHFSDPKHPSLKLDQIINLRNVHDFLLGCPAFLLLSWMLFKKNYLWFQGFSSFFSSQTLAFPPSQRHEGFSALGGFQGFQLFCVTHIP